MYFPEPFFSKKAEQIPYVCLSVRNTIGHMGFTELLLELDFCFFLSKFPLQWSIFRYITSMAVWLSLSSVLIFKELAVSPLASRGFVPRGN